MKKKNFIFYNKPVTLFLGLLVYYLPSFGQNWEKLADTKDWITPLIEFHGDLYGLEYENQVYLVKWNGTDFCKVENDQVKIGQNALNDIIPMCVYKDQLIVWASFTDKTGKSFDLAGWDGQNWHPLGDGTSGQATPRMTVFRDELYVNAFYKNEVPTGYMPLSKWNGNNWESLNIGKGSNRYIRAAGFYGFAVFKDELYVTGGFDSINSLKCKGIARWNGSRWDSVGPGAWWPEPSFWNTTMQVFKNTLYVSTPPYNELEWAKWDGENWQSATMAQPWQWPNTNDFNFEANLNDSLLFVTFIINSSESAYYYGDGTHWYKDTILFDYWLTPPTLGVYKGELYATTPTQFLKWNPKHLETSHTPQYKIFPNPATDYLTIETYYPGAKMDFELYNCAGQRLLSGILPPNTCCTTVSTENYPPGLYFLRLRSGNNWKIEKIELMR